MGERGIEFYDLKVEVVAGAQPMICGQPVGSYFVVEGESLVFPEVNRFPVYPFAAILPLLPAMRKVTDENDWMTTDAKIAFPDPHCGGRFRVTRLSKRRFTHAETTGLPDARGRPYWQERTGDG